MPKSRYVSADRLLRMLLYVAASVVVLVGGTAILDALGAGAEIRRGWALAFLVLFPVGGWIVWRRTRDAGAH